MTARFDSPEVREGEVSVVRETAQVVALCVRGDFDLVNAPLLDASIRGAFDDGADVIVDVSDATFIDSHVVQVLMRAAREAAASQRGLVLQAGTASIVRRVLDLVRIDEVLPTTDDRRHALRLITQRAEARNGSNGRAAAGAV